MNVASFIGQLSTGHLKNEIASVVAGWNYLDAKFPFHILYGEVVKKHIVVADHRLGRQDDKIAVDAAFEGRNEVAAS